MPNLEKLIKMHEANQLPIREIVSFVVKYIAVNGTKEDFNSLPTEIQNEVLKAIEWYKEKKAWFIVSNLGMEDYKDYAEEFIKKIETKK